jgi:hypothetical protein
MVPGFPGSTAVSHPHLIDPIALFCRKVKIIDLYVT